ncbi:proteinaceous RNase P 1, chloroplastic/mitochondrial-like [Cornus florida]|uniref:proteinaceous RNase P 1, chloroplastic/mitochondrial-like n=1 Tax=Cornus florida TaxID=4283 RepID=UPI0028A2C36D|nr:proteinaceous RNase P 1, chloroplastic/mitochondrial-like [Cornus florida]
MLLRVGCLFSFIKSPILSLCYCNRFHRPLLRYYSSFKPVNARIQYLNRLSMDKLTHPYTTATLVREPSSQPSTRPKKKLRRDSPEGVLRHKLDMCSKRGDLVEALKHYDEARVNQIPILLHHYNVLLYLCSSSASNVDCEENEEGSKRVCDLGLERGFEIFKQMGVDKVAPNEATFTSLARLAAAKEDPESAFDLVKHMRTCGLPPRLRSYGPALFGFCKKGMVDKAFEVDAHMGESGVLVEEAEISALLKVSSETKRADKVYEMLHRLRAMVRQVSEETARVLEDWFGSESGTEVGVENWDVEKVREGVVKGGGGWHGQGWLGSGKWRVVQTQMDQTGVCHSCGEKLVCIDIDPKETENFATSLASLACEREVKTNFMQFQEWLQRHGPFDAVIDGANVGLTDQHSFSFSQLNFVVNQLTQISPSKRLPLIILHRNRVTNGPALSHNNKKFIESWKKSGALYATPRGSNDDWYWLYAAVSCKCLLVTNDEMRDHLFELLGTSFFPRWKEKHQVRLTVSRRGPTLHMPPPYSIVIQESEQGSWHVPTVTGNDVETPRQWVCATRARDS